MKKNILSKLILSILPITAPLIAACSTTIPAKPDGFNLDKYKNAGGNFTVFISALNAFKNKYSSNVTLLNIFVGLKELLKVNIIPDEDLEVLKSFNFKDSLENGLPIYTIELRIESKIDSTKFADIVYKISVNQPNLSQFDNLKTSIIKQAEYQSFYSDFKTGFTDPAAFLKRLESIINVTIDSKFLVPLSSSLILIEPALITGSNEFEIAIGFETSTGNNLEIKKIKFQFDTRIEADQVKDYFS
jgi:hypothetical protein